MTMILIDDCCVCGSPCRFNPELAPNFHDRPICRRCVESANVDRAVRGIELIEIPNDSYGEQ